MTECNHNNFVIKTADGKNRCLQCHKNVVAVEVVDVTDDGSGPILNDITIWNLESEPVIECETMDLAMGPEVVTTIPLAVSADLTARLVDGSGVIG
jgi:hypothetical protein